MIKKILIAGLVSISLFSCKGQNKEVTMEEIIKSELALTQSYNHRPLFGAQVNKTACKVIIENEGGIDYRFTDNTGESMMLPLNVLILKKGKQKLRIKIYPIDGETFLSKHATTSITIYRSPDKDSSMKAYQKLVQFELPMNIQEQKLPYYETIVEFDADVPYNYQKELDSAKYLSKIPGIEKKVVEKYNILRNMGINTDNISYLLENIHSFGIVSNTLYNNTYQEVKSVYNTKSGIVDDDPLISNRKFLKIEDYNLQFYANGKIVALWQKNHRPMLYFTATIKKGTKDERQFDGGDPIFLYMPAGSNELKVW